MALPQSSSDPDVSLSELPAKAPIYTLPPELWEAIAHAVEAVDEAIRNGVIIEAEPEPGAWDSYYLRAFAYTCKQAYEACVPTLFASLDLEDYLPVEAVDRYIAEVLPKRGELVLKLVFRLRPEDEEDDEETEDEEAEGQSRWLSRGDGIDRQRRFKQLLTLVLNLPSLRELNIDVVDNSPENELLLKASIAARAATLKFLELDGAFDGVVRPTWLAGVIRALPHLEALIVAFGGEPDPLVDTSLAEALSLAPKLHLLDLDIVEFITPTFASVIRMQGLEMLRLRGIEDLPLSTLETLLANVGASLQTLELVDAPSEEVLGAGEPFPLVKLDALRLQGLLPSVVFMRRFKRSPIIDLEIGPLVPDEEIREAALGEDEPMPLSVVTLKAMLDDGALPELKRLTLIGETLYEDAVEIREACAARGIEYNFELEEMSDVEVDDEDDDGFDDNLSDQSWMTEDEDDDAVTGSDDDVDDFGE